MMSKQSWLKWGLLIVGSTFVMAGIGNCIAQLLLQSFILRAVQ
jgi:hypothetical protein